MENLATKNNPLRRRKRKDALFFASLVVLPLLQFTLFYICVNFNSVLLALKEYDALTGEMSWVGFANFKKFFYELTHTTLFTVAIRNSLVAWAVNMFVGILLGMIFSYYIFKKMPMHGIFKVLLFLPSIVSSIVMVMVYRQFIEKGLTAFLALFGAKGQGLLANPDTRFGAILFYNLWVGFGTQILMFLGAMNNVSDSVLEAAKIDGASFLREFVYVVIPLVYPTFVVFVTVGVVQIFTNQLALYSFYGDSAELQDYTIGYYLYRGVQAGRNSDYPYLAAIGLLCTFVAIPVTFFVRFLLKKLGPGEE